ncbi:uncharacterized protein LOC110901896 [Helianthus annuus]|uniref:uncharacterized protein LOC110901896 n=1 Tax=Helianthus annuus TaxID=4232 RepID=UPI000B8FD02A|nr:uncharacterized protein LOC110901896 [Helianthus annuus]
MASINLVYTQLSAQQALLQAQANQSAFVTPPQRSLSTHTTQQINAWNLRPEKGPVPNIRKPSAHDTRDTYGETESNYVQNPQRRPIQSHLGARNMNTEWDDGEDDPTYKGESTVFSRLHPEHESYKPAKRVGDNPKAEHDYTLSYRPYDMAKNSKFIKEIATAAIDKTKLPHNVGKYNGLTDPDDHLQVFNGAGATGGWNLPTWCHLFAQTFVGAARIWFDSLPAGRIKSWIDFREKFLAHFSQQRRNTRDPADCLNIWRKDHESVEDFITRYNKECLEIGDVGEKMMHVHFMRAVKCDDLIKRVKGRDGGPKDWETFIEAAKTIAQTDKQLTGDDHRQRGYNHNDRHNKKGRSQPWKASGHRERSPAREDARHTINHIAHRKEEQCFNQFDQVDKTRLEPVDYPLTGFYNEAVFPFGQISFPVLLSDGRNSRTEEVTFMVLPAHSRHDILLGRESQGDFSMICSGPHSAVGFPTETGVAIIYASKEVLATDEVRLAKASKPAPRTEAEKWVLNSAYLEQTVTLGPAMSDLTRATLKKLLFQNMDVFAWTPADMVGVPWNIAEHRLNVSEEAKPVVHAKRHLGDIKHDAMKEQVMELLNVGIIREVRYQTWVASPVMVQKPNGSWRMCVDYKDLNKACPRDCYALPDIDEKIDSLATFRWKCFLDCYKGYYQVQMAIQDEDKTAFRTPTGLYCYTKMPFGLKNAGATYQRLMNETFKDAIGNYIEVYMDELVIMSKEESLMLVNIQKTFDTLRGVSIKLNPAKCSFGMEEGKFLGFIVTKDGFKVNPEKVQAIERMPSPSTMKEMQKLAGRLAALNRFLANHAAKSFPFIKTLRNCMKKSQFQCTPEAESAFREMKDCLIKLSTLTAPIKGEPLVLYLSASDRAVGAVLLVDRQGVQTPVYYVSRTLTDPETRYAIMEKLVLALIRASRRLRMYFANHVIHVLTNYNISNIFTRPQISGRLAKWAIELGGHNVVFRPRPAIKGQVLADFMTEVPDDKDRECKAMEKAEKQQVEEPWLLYTDGASNEDGADAGLRLVSPDNHEFTYAIRLDFKSTNNEAEYEAFLAGLRLAIKMGVKHIEALVDSMLVAGQINGQYEAKGDLMALYLNQAKTLLQTFYSYKVHHINRSENKPADTLSKLASTSFQHLAKDVRIEVLSNPSVPLREVSVIQVGTMSWMTPIITYLRSGILPENKAEARKIQYKAEHYQMADGILYRKSYLGPLLRCVDPEDANYLIREIHEGICGIHAGPRMVVAKVMNVGYYWPGMHLDAWGIDMVGPFPEAPGAVKFIIVAVDGFTKWVEAKALASTTSTVVKRFIWEQIICRFGLPLKIFTDNGTNFAADDLQQWFRELHIEHTFSSVAHPQGNGQVEAVNKSIVDGIKARLGEKKRGWVDELPSILWAHITMPKTSNGETPFS